MTDRLSFPLLEARPQPAPPAVSPPRVAPEQRQVAPRRGGLSPFNREAATGECLGIAVAFGAAPEWLPQLRRWITTSIGMDALTGELVTAVPTLDRGPPVITRGPDALVQLARGVTDLFRTTLRWGQDPYAWVQDELKAVHGWDHDLTDGWLRGHVWRERSGLIGFKPWTTDAKLASIEPVRFGRNELLPVIAAEAARVIAADLAAFRRGHV